MNIAFYLFYAATIFKLMAVSGIILALAYTLSPSQWKQSINHFFNLEGME
jgi:quinol-cytochrome oxidoreductase complex cytochrome b subunit